MKNYVQTSPPETMKDLEVKAVESSEFVANVLKKLLSHMNTPSDTNDPEVLNAKLLLKESPTVISVLNFHTCRCLSVSENVKDLMGVHADELTENDIYWGLRFIAEEQRTIYTEKMLPLALQWFQGLSKQGKDITRARLQYTLNILTKEGKQISTLHVLRPLTFDESGLPILAVKYITDITSVQEAGEPVMFMEYKEGDCSFVRIHYKSFSLKTDYALSSRESEIVRMIQSGYSSKRIADELCLSIHTINNHRKNIIKKYNIRNFYNFQFIEKTG